MDYYRAEINRLNTAGLVSKMEFVTLTEGLVIISNQFSDYSKQSCFIQEVMSPITVRLGTLQPHFNGPDQL